MNRDIIFNLSGSNGRQIAPERKGQGSEAAAPESKIMDDFERRLREREDARKLDRITDATQAADQKAVNDYLLQNSKNEFSKVSAAFPALIERANSVLSNDPQKFGLRDQHNTSLSGHCKCGTDLQPAICKRWRDHDLFVGWCDTGHSSYRREIARIEEL